MKKKPENERFSGNAPPLIIALITIQSQEAKGYFPNELLYLQTQ